MSIKDRIQAKIDSLELKAISIYDEYEHPDTDIDGYTFANLREEMKAIRSKIEVLEELRDEIY